MLQNIWKGSRVGRLPRGLRGGVPPLLRALGYASRPALHVLGERVRFWRPVPLRVLPRRERVLPGHDVLPPEIAQRFVHRRPVLHVAPHAVYGGAVAHGVAEHVAVRAVEDRHQALHLRHVVPRDGRVRHGVQRVALVPGALDLEHARHARRVLRAFRNRLGVRPRAGDETVRGGAEPELGFVRGQHAKQHVRDVRAGQALVRLHSLVLAAGAPLGGVVAREGLGQTQLLLPQLRAPAAPEPERVAERRRGQTRGAKRVPRVAALLLERQRTHETGAPVREMRVRSFRETAELNETADADVGSTL
mmetsp:Transcript_5351/g.21630  ORF Transcript_5351/g.21630 Transcript_5351/m.21630 type:complete len:305 (+) Transcript_5351:70-984(+)